MGSLINNPKYDKKGRVRYVNVKELKKVFWIKKGGVNENIKYEKEESQTGYRVIYFDHYRREEFRISRHLFVVSKVEKNEVIV